jgi:hypothetical protein
MCNHFFLYELGMVQFVSFPVITFGLSIHRTIEHEHDYDYM